MVFALKAQKSVSLRKRISLHLRLKLMHKCHQTEKKVKFRDKIG